MLRLVKPPTCTNKKQQQYRGMNNRNTCTVNGLNTGRYVPDMSCLLLYANVRYSTKFSGRFINGIQSINLIVVVIQLNRE